MTIRLLTSAVCAAALLAGSPAWADPPPWAGGGKGSSDAKGKGKGKGHGKGHARMNHFADDHRVYVHEYFEGEFRGGKCPPGLAKKRNGCMPPGQAKKWRMGQPLPRDVVYYPVPQDLVVRLGPPPSGHRYVRVAADILMITVGTAIVVDAIQDLGRMR